MDKKIPISHSLIGLFITILSIIFFVTNGFSAFWGISLGLFICITIGFLNGFRITKLLKLSLEGVKNAYIVLLIMCLIGVIIAIWMVCGTIPTLMYYGFNYLSNVNFLLAAFLISSFISLILGTSVGTISTAGIPLMGIGLGLGVPAYMTAGAIVSGAFLGDRTSPMSSSANLTAVITETDLYENIKHMIPTLVPAFIISTLFYYIIGSEYTLHESTINTVNDIKNTLNTGFNISPLLLIPPAIIIIMSILKINIKYNLIAGIAIGVLLAITQQDVNIVELIKVSVLGFESQSIEVAKIISGGGLLAMKGILSVVASATALYGILDGTNMLRPLINKFISNIQSIRMLVFKTTILGVLMNIVTLNQTLAIIIPGKSMASSFEKFNVSKNTLARTIGDSGTVIAPLIPWNINGLVISVALGSEVIEYAPFAVLCYVLPFISLIFAHFGLVKKDHLINDDLSSQ